jgi:hypothetical protein
MVTPAPAPAAAELLPRPLASTSPMASEPPVASASGRPAAPAPESIVGSAPVQSPGRFNNPFLQQDPSTRARRLARALVSDLVVYYPEKRQRGLAEGNLKELFGEEIRKSWEEYSEQVGQDIAANTPYFTEALNEILAEGRSLFG